MAATKISLILVVDKEKNRVLFAESDKDFVDILFSFLTLPMGTVIRVLGKQSSVGCFDKLYESVENLDEKFLQTKACKNMLLQPGCSLGLDLMFLKTRLDDIDPRPYYVCSFHGNNIASARCSCASKMDFSVQSNVGGVDDDGVFVKGVRFIIGDGLQVVKASTGATLSLLQNFGIKNADAIDRKTVQLGRQEILDFLKRTLLSKTPLTDMFLKKIQGSETSTEVIKLIDLTTVKSENDAAVDLEKKVDSKKKICIKLFKSSLTNKVIYAEAENDFADLIVSFLTFPLGLIVKLLSKNSFAGSIDNLYNCVENLGVGDCIKSDEYKNSLIDPKLPLHYGCSSSLFKIDEISYWNGYRSLSLNPKLPEPGSEKGGGFTRRLLKFTVTNESAITIFSPALSIELLKESKVPIDCLVEEEVTIGEQEALKLLKACVNSRSALSSVFSPKVMSSSE